MLVFGFIPFFQLALRVISKVIGIFVLRFPFILVAVDVYVILISVMTLVPLACVFLFKCQILLQKPFLLLALD